MSSDRDDCLDVSSGCLVSGRSVWAKRWEALCAKPWFYPFGALEELRGSIYEQRAIWERNQAKRPLLARVAGLWMLVALGFFTLGAMFQDHSIWICAICMIVFAILVPMAVTVLAVWFLLFKPFND